MRSYLTLLVLCNMLLSASAQKVGINTDTPTTDLDIRTNDVNDGAELNVGNQDNSHFLRLFSGRPAFPSSVLYWKEGYPLLFGTDENNFTERVRITPEGMIGIGVPDPQSRLDLLGGQWNVSSTEGDLRIGNPTYRLVAGVALSGGGAGISRLYAKGGEAKLIFGSDNSDVMVIDSANRVGIGTLTPINRLDIRADGIPDTTSTVLALISDISNRPVLQFSEWETGLPGSGMSIEYDGTDPKNPIHIRSVDGQRKFTFNTFGQLGIGVTNPNELLEIAGTGRVFIGDGGGANRKGLLIDAVEPGNYVRLNPFDYSTATNMDLYLPVNVGVGTSSPTAALHILGAENSGSNAAVKISNTAGMVTHDLLIDGNEIDAISTFMELQHNTAGSILMVRGGGNVGIGTASPNARLDVAGTVSIQAIAPATGYALSVGGKIIAEEVRVQLESDWPDYVFEEDYALPDLTFVASFIHAKKHLPGIPAASQIAQEGLMLGEMQSRMMQKIEELTLYIIDLHRRMHALETENQRLKNTFQSR